MTGSARSTRIIGLTGGIGTGKSTAAQALAQLEIPVLDADRLAREAVAPGSAILHRVIDHFGTEILDDTGHLDRRQLGRRIFSDPVEKRWLEDQIHPDVRQRMIQWIPQAAQSSAVICLMIPLLFEAQMTDLVTEIWVVTCSADQQLQRLHQRDGLTPTEIHSRIASQWPLSTKIPQADVVLDNSGSLESLQAQIQQALGSPALS